MSYLRQTLACDLEVGDQIDLTPLAEELDLKPAERYAIRDAYATITAISEHGGFVDIGTDIVDLQVRAADVVTLLVDED